MCNKSKVYFPPSPTFDMMMWAVRREQHHNVIILSTIQLHTRGEKTRINCTSVFFYFHDDFNLSSNYKYC